MIAPRLVAWAAPRLVVRRLARPPAWSPTGCCAFSTQGPRRNESKPETASGANPNAGNDKGQREPSVASKMAESAATTFASILVLGLGFAAAGYIYHRSYKMLVVNKMVRAFEPGDPVLDLAAVAKDMPSHRETSEERWVHRSEQAIVDAIVDGPWNNGSTLSGLTKLWFWTPRWDSFLVLPCKQVSSATTTPAQPNVHQDTPIPNLGTSPELASIPEPDGLVQAGPDRRSFLSCPRLSLNLGNIALQLPSMLNLMTLDGLHPFRSLSSSTRSASPPEAEGAGGAARRFGVYAERTEPAPIPNSFTLDSQAQRTNQEFFLSPAGNDIDQFSRQYVSTHTTRQIANRQPVQDSAIYNQSANPEAGPWSLRGRTAVAGSCNDRDGPSVTVSTNAGLVRPPRSSSVAKRLHQHVAGGEIVTPVAARKVGKLVAGASVVSMHAAHSEDFALPDVADEERALRPPPLHVVRQRPHAAGGRGLRERDTTRRDLFRSSNDDDNDLRGLLRHLGDARETRPAPWSPLRYPGGSGSGSGSQPATPETRRQSSVLSHLSITPTALRLGLAMRGRSGEESEEEHSGLSPRRRRVGATHQPVPDSPTLPVVGPQVKMRRSSRRASHGSL